MSARKLYKQGMRCVCCGRGLEPPKVHKKCGMTKDHVYPVSATKTSELPSRVQQMCAECNAIKTNLAPTAFLYRIIGAFIFASKSDKGLLPIKIEENLNSSLVEGYRVYLQCDILVHISCVSSHWSVEYNQPKGSDIRKTRMSRLTKIMKYVYLQDFSF